ncbi:Na-translocating system protein MpsC family protein [Cytobacillus sp. FJAT-54145]|uniref:Na-translocating system protein MpsC family protein n=1 Tax=Cytobacillus spartinae TaxID=3299023 RepID=A0ABW6KB71_9BACI
MDIKKVQTDLASYIGRSLRENFGKGPESVFVSINQGYITVYLRNFTSPTENILLSKDQDGMVQKTRDMLMQTLIPEFKAYIRVLTELDVREFYYDWNLHNRSGMFVCIASPPEQIIDNQFHGKSEFNNEIISVSIQAQKAPEEITSYLLNNRTLVAIRNGILVSIEKELIRLGSSETLKLAKRNLEKRLLHNNDHFEKILNTKIKDIFVDWDFTLDKSVITFILSPKL